MSDKAEDNLEYSTKKYFKQSFKKYADIVEKGLKEGYGKLSQTDINVMSGRYDRLVKSGADKSEAEKQMKSIVKEYMINKSIKSDGIDDNVTRLKKLKFKDA
tara:strand:- start:302 stop:607 length:306 start_codon:yes stop_codon:yes gene_type:complete